MQIHSFEKLNRIVNFYNLPIKKEFKLRYSKIKDLSKLNMDIDVGLFEIKQDDKLWMFSIDCISCNTNNKKILFYHNSKKEITKKIYIKISDSDCRSHGLSLDFDINHKMIVRYIWFGKYLK